MQKAAVNNYLDCENISEQALNHLGFPDTSGLGGLSWTLGSQRHVRR